MLSMRSRFVFILAAGWLLVPVGSWAEDSQVQEQAATTVAHELEQIPMGQVAVTYENGEVTVKARNATLGQVLRAICTQIGAGLDAESDDPEPIVGTFGPGAAKDVLASLLIGSRFNYVMQASDDDPKILARIIVVPKAKDSNAQDRLAHNQLPQNQVTQPQVSSTPAQDQIAQNQVTHPQVSPTPTSPVAEESGLKQMKELLMQAKAEIANSGVDVSDAQGGGGNAGVGDAAGADMANLLQQVESSITAIAAEPADANPAPQEASAVPINPGRRHHRR
jgi:hypothetical protein